MQPEKQGFAKEFIDYLEQRLLNKNVEIAGTIKNQKHMSLKMALTNDRTRMLLKTERAELKVIMYKFMDIYERDNQ